MASSETKNTTKRPIQNAFENRKLKAMTQKLDSLLFPVALGNPLTQKYFR